MKPMSKEVFLSSVLLAFCAVSHAQIGVKAAGGKTISLASAQFKMRPINCVADDCGTYPKLKLRDICKVAICLPLEAKEVTTVLGPDVLHWRMNKAKGTMAQYLGDSQLTASIKATAPPIAASVGDVKALPVIGMKTPTGQTSQYWVWVK